MALTIDEVTSWSIGDRRAVIANVDFDASYPTGGESLTAADLGFSLSVDLVLAEPQTGLIFEYDRTNSKLLAFVQGIDTGAAGAATIDDFPVTAGVGTTAVSVGLTAASPRFGGLKQIANTTDMSTITDVRVFAVGR